MKIFIKEEKDKKIKKFCIPRCCCSFGASIVTRILASKSSKILSKDGVQKEVKPLSKEQGRKIRKMIRYLNKNYKGLVIVDVETKDEIVKIII